MNSKASIFLIERFGAEVAATYILLREFGDIGNEQLKVKLGIGSSTTIRKIFRILEKAGYIKISSGRGKRDIEVLEPKELKHILMSTENYCRECGEILQKSTVNNTFAASNISIDSNRLLEAKNTNNTIDSVDQQYSKRLRDIRIRLENEEKINSTLILKYFCERFLDKYGIEYIPSYKRDRKIFKDLAKKLGNNEACLILIDEYFDHIDIYTNERYNKANVKAFAQGWMINKLAMNVVKRQEEKELKEQNSELEEQLLQKSANDLL